MLIKHTLWTALRRPFWILRSLWALRSPGAKVKQSHEDELPKVEPILMFKCLPNKQNKLPRNQIAAGQEASNLQRAVNRQPGIRPGNP